MANIHKTAEQICTELSSTNFGDCNVTVVGYGFVGKEYVRALRRLSVGRIRVCSRSAEKMEELKGLERVEICPGGYQSLTTPALPGELAVLGTTTDQLVPAARHLAQLGYKRMLIEKPVALFAKDIEQLAALLDKLGVQSYVAYNRVAYPSVCELNARAQMDGGITSCSYTFTEMIKPDWPQKLIPEELARWGIANSLHVMSLAHHLIGLPIEFSCYRSGWGRQPWHTGAAQCAGAGISEHGIPFSYHSDWGSAGRWSVEVHTPRASYRLCPLEELLVKTAPLAEWEKVSVPRLDGSLKAGFVEELASVLKTELSTRIPLWTISRAAAMTRFGETVFGYANS